MGKSERELRSGTRKDYAKMADINSDSDSHVREPGLIINQNKNKSDEDGGEIINNEFLLSDDEESCSDVDGELVESSDEEVRIAREELEQLKSKQKELAKQSKLRKIAEEKKAVRKSLEKIEAKKRTSGHVTGGFFAKNGGCGGEGGQINGQESET